VCLSDSKLAILASSIKIKTYETGKQAIAPVLDNVSNDSYNQVTMVGLKAIGSKAFPKSNNTLLDAFIDSKLANYVEPTKKGTPKGEPVGFSLTKYKATLYALRSEDVKAQSKALGISYGLLRKWRTEEAFKRLVFQHREEFANSFSDAVRLSSSMWKSDGEIRDKFRELELLKNLLGGKFQAVQSEGEKEAIRKLLMMILGRINDELMGSCNLPSGDDLRKYQKLVLDLAVEMLQDQQVTIKYRKDLANLLSRLKQTIV
jgi:hypothetical protein